MGQVSLHLTYFKTGSWPESEWKQHMISIGCKLIKKRVTLRVFQTINNSLSNKQLFSFISVLGFNFANQLFLSLDDLIILPVSHQFQMDSCLQGSHINLCFGSSAYFLRLLISHAILLDLIIMFRVGFLKSKLCYTKLVYGILNKTI